jgi:hypothetical protein
MRCQDFTAKLKSTGHLHNNLNEWRRAEVAAEITEYDQIKCARREASRKTRLARLDIEKACTSLLGACYEVRQRISRDYLYASPGELCREFTIRTTRLERAAVRCPGQCRDSCLIALAHIF